MTSSRQWLLMSLMAVMMLSCLADDGSLWYPCTGQPEAFNLTLGNAFVEVRNTSVALFPRNNYTDTVLRESNIILTLRGIQEWHTTSGSCDEPGSPSGGDSNTFPYTALLVEDMECAVGVFNGTLQGGRLITSIVTRVRHPSHPDLAITFNVTKSFGTFEQIYTGVPTTNFVPYVIQYRTGSFKVTLDIENFPYSGPENVTHLVGYLTGGGVLGEDGIIKYQEQPDMLKFSLNATNPNSTLRLLQDVDRGFLLDGVPYMNSMPHSGNLFPIPANFSYSLDFSFAFCHYYPPGFRVKRLYWDPQLTVLFDAVPPEEEEEPISPETPLTAPQFFKKKVQLGLAVGLSVGAVVLIGAFILVYAFSPKLQSIFQPYKNSDHTSKPQTTVKRDIDTSSRPTTSSWSSGHGGGPLRNTVEP